MTTAPTLNNLCPSTSTLALVVFESSFSETYEAAIMAMRGDEMLYGVHDLGRVDAHDVAAVTIGKILERAWDAGFEFPAGTNAWTWHNDSAAPDMEVRSLAVARR